jgi:predicted MFS family arabinose efflux permease
MMPAVAGTTLTRGLRSYRDLLAQPGVGPLVGWGLLARLPAGMLALGLVLLVRGAGRSYADAGLVSAVEALAFATGAPVAGRLIDRRRPAAVLIAYGIAYPAALVVLVQLARSGVPMWVLMASAVVVGLTQPPVASTIRMLWPSLTGEALQPTAFALEATLQELFFIAGPLLVGATTALISPSAGILAAAVLSTVGVAGFVASAPVRRHRHEPHQHSHGHLLAALSPPTVRAIIAFAACYGLAFGAVEVAMPAFAEQHGGRSLGSVCLAAWAGGSLVGGLLASGQRPSDPHRRLQIIGTVFVGLLALPLLAGSVPVMAALMFLAGLPIAPSVAITYAMVQKAARPRTEAEVFGWLSTAVVVGYAAGAGVGGSLISHSGPNGSIVLGMCGIAVATLIAPNGALAT